MGCCKIDVCEFYLFFERRGILETQKLNATDILSASEVILNGELLGLPTETVYGLAANGLDENAVANIFKVKGRPADNPLILHILKEPTWLQRYCKNIPDTAWRLIDQFWPGPLTLILERKGIVPDIVTAGLDTVGVRCPNHPVALAVMEASNLPLAAPSGNLSGKPSPTSSEVMFADMEGKIPAIIDGGNCLVGVESTILQLAEKPKLLRAGGISVEEIEAVLGEKIEIDPTLFGINVAKNLIESKEAPMPTDDLKPLAPGMKYRHYAPEAPVTVILGKESANWISQQAKEGDGVICFQEYLHLFPKCVTQSIGKETDFTTQAQRVFAALRFFDSTEVPRIWSQCPDENKLGLAVSNRLQKAAGFRVIRIEEA